MLVRGFPQLAAQVAEGAFGQEVHAAASHAGNPVHRCAVVHESEDLHPVQETGRSRPAADMGAGFPFAVRDAGRSHLNPVNLEFLQQQTGYGQFLVRIERDTGGLLSVAEGGIHYFQHRAFCS